MQELADQLSPQLTLNLFRRLIPLHLVLADGDTLKDLHQMQNQLEPTTLRDMQLQRPSTVTELVYICAYEVGSI